MMDASDVIAQAANGHVKEIATDMEITLTRMYEILGKDNPYPKAKRLIRKIARRNPRGVRLIKADLDALFAELLGDTPEVTVADLHKETCEAVQSILDDAPVAVQKKEIREAIVASEGMLQSLDTRETAKNAVNDFRQRNGRVH